MLMRFWDTGALMRIIEPALKLQAIQLLAYYFELTYAKSEVRPI